MLAGRDVEALAEPGSGKTLAYLLPAAVVRCCGGSGGVATVLAFKPGFWGAPATSGGCMWRSSVRIMVHTPH